MTLVNDGTIVATGINALIIDTGSNVVINAGTLEATGSGGLIVNSDVANSGLIWAYGGNITIMGAVTGSGSALISGAATLEFGAASSINVTFAGANFGTLVLDSPTAYTGQIFGFTGTSPQNSDLIDLHGITFDAGTSWTYNDNTGSNTGGALTIFETANGITTVVDSITFGNGDYTTANFILATDGHGGTLVADPPASSAATVDSGTILDITGTSAQNVDFANDDGNTGTLVLNDPIAFAGQISGFTGTSTISDAIDLKGITFDSGTTFTYTPNSAGTGGTLTIFEGATVVDTINFAGNYTTANFTAQSDGNGGTLITDPPTSSGTGSILIADNIESYGVGSPIFALAGNDQLTGSHGADQFVFAQPMSHDVIYSFDTAADKIDLVGFGGFSDFSAVAAHLADDGAGNAVLTLAADE